MRFWDSSALVPLLVDEPHTRLAQQRLEADPDLIVWWGTSLECASALERRAREGVLGETPRARAFDRLQALRTAWTEVEPTAEVRTQALRLLRIHPLRAADALQLAAALVWAQHDPTGLGFYTDDERLRTAAMKEGFEVGA